MNHNITIRNKNIFSQKVYFYRNSRPRYPALVFEYLASLLKTGSKIVEFGCGTGIFTKDLLKYDYEVYAVEPCSEMLAACKVELMHSNKLTFIESSAEDAILNKASFDVFIFPQSLHWMDIKKIKKIIAHAAKSNYHIIVVWNSRKNSNTNCAKEYNEIVKSFKKKHTTSIQMQTDSYELLNKLYGENKYKILKTQHTHQLTQQSSEYLFLSTSDIDLDAFDLSVKKELISWFNKYHVNGYVPIEYDCFMAVSVAHEFLPC